MVREAGGGRDNQPHHSGLCPLIAVPTASEATSAQQVGFFLFLLLFFLLLLLVLVSSGGGRSLQVVAEVKLGERATAVAAGHLPASELHT